MPSRTETAVEKRTVKHPGHKRTGHFFSRLAFWRRKKLKKKQPRRETPKWLAPLANFGTGEERALFMESIAMLLDSGMDVLSALKATQAEVRTRRMKQVLTQIHEDVNNGQQLWRAIADTRMLKPYVVSLIRIGENAGRLAENLRVIVIQQQKERAFRSKLRSAMAYPVLVLVIAFVLGIGLAVYILPRLENVFGSLNIELPLITKVLLAIGAFMDDHGVIVVPVALVSGALLVYILFFFSRTKVIGQWLFFHTPGVRRLIREVELARFGYVLGTLLQAGLPIVDAIKSLKDATTFFSYDKLYGFMAEQTESGESFRTSFSAFKKTKRLIPMSIQQMVISGEQSGRLPEALVKIGEIYEAKTETTAKNLTTILEPILLVVVWVGVATVAFSVILPIYGLIGGLNEARTQPAPEETAAPSAPAGDTIGEAESTPEPVVAPSRVRIIQLAAGTLNVRGGPGTSFPVVASVNSNEEYPFDNTEDDEDGIPLWYQVVVVEGDESADEDVVGWISADFVEVLNDDGTIAEPEVEPELPATDETDADDDTSE